jgi:hypothetical protein
VGTGYQRTTSVLGESLGDRSGESACAIAEAVGDLGLRVVANFYLGQALWWSGDPRRAADAMARSSPSSGRAARERFGLAGCRR